MGCSCPMLRGTCNAATVLDGRARRVGRVFRWVPKTPPGLPPFPSGGVRIGEHRARQKTLERSPLRGRYARKGDLFIAREVNDEARPDHCRNPGHFGFHRLGRGGKCAGEYRPERLPASYGRAVRSEGTSLWAFSKICPSSLPSLCSSDLSSSDLWRSWRSSYDVFR